MLHEDITGPVIGAFYEVHKTLGYGFLEKVYENSLVVALRERGLRVHQKHQSAFSFTVLLLASTLPIWLWKTG